MLVSKGKIDYVLCVLLLLGMVNGETRATGSRRTCEFQAIYNFGDSNSDTGGRSAAIGEIPPPNGITFFGRPSGRACDGRVILDFIAESLGLPYLSAYLDSTGTSFRHGANFATGGSSILPGGYSPFHLDLQISQFLQFKRRNIALYKQRSMATCTSSLPSPNDFPNALYTFDIGQNDLTHGFQYSDEARVLASIPNILDKFSQAINQLYNEEARFFWVHNTGPIGCLPYSVIYKGPNPRNLDRNGCVESQNMVAREFNKQLEDRVSQLRAHLPLASFTYVDVYTAKYNLISNAKTLGFEEPMSFCCGSYYGYHVFCGGRAVVNGTVYGNPCESPSRHISWDGIHYTEAANFIISRSILNGTLSSPPHSISQACYHQS